MEVEDCSYCFRAVSVFPFFFFFFIHLMNIDLFLGFKLSNLSIPLSIPKCSCYICCDYNFCFSFSAGVGWRGWGGGVLRQVQGLVSNTPFFFLRSTSFMFNSRVASFSDVFSTHTLHGVHSSTSMKSFVYWTWKFVITFCRGTFLQLLS